jgi:hypothetical protein
MPKEADERNVADAAMKAIDGYDTDTARWVREHREKATEQDEDAWRYWSELAGYIDKMLYDNTLAWNYLQLDIFPEEA